MNKDVPRVQLQVDNLWRVALTFGGCLVLCPTLPSCAKRHALPTAELYRRIQVHEAAIATANHGVMTARSCREIHAPTEQGVCDESVALCRLSDKTDEVDALHRCVVASDSCRAARERARALCAKPSAE